MMKFTFKNVDWPICLILLFTIQKNWSSYTYVISRRNWITSPITYVLVSPEKIKRHKYFLFKKAFFISHCKLLAFKVRTCCLFFLIFFIYIYIHNKAQFTFFVGPQVSRDMTQEWRHSFYLNKIKETLFPFLFILTFSYMHRIQRPATRFTDITSFATILFLGRLKTQRDQMTRHIDFLLKTRGPPIVW